MKKRNEDQKLLAEINGEVNMRQTALTIAMIAVLIAIICGCVSFIHNLNASAMEEPVAYEVSYDTEITQEELDEILSVAPTDAIKAADEALDGQGTAEEWVEAIVAADPDFAETAEEILAEE